MLLFYSFGSEIYVNIMEDLLVFDIFEFCIRDFVEFVDDVLMVVEKFEQFLDDVIYIVEYFFGFGGVFDFLYDNMVMFEVFQEFGWGGIEEEMVQFILVMWKWCCVVCW